MGCLGYGTDILDTDEEKRSFCLAFSPCYRLRDSTGFGLLGWLLESGFASFPFGWDSSGGVGWSVLGLCVRVFVSFVDRFDAS